MNRLPNTSAARLALLGLAALLVFGNCSKNVYRVLGPGTTAQQVAQLKRLNDSVYARYREADRQPAGAASPTTQQIFDSANVQRRRILTPAQYNRYRYQLLPLRYPKRPPRGYR